ncbi:orotate phosphoribosyltransferase [Ignisphaera sp. 4213-co]|uniref:Orotate phosphoribosyltransferase n=1 Tax=Ignisphaera cupida TaxID=3050454 RepID=A0ABD4Z841_9CREN|nr:orotate phosphoribosyltransferase [Ignisphaera sp. 4213-co]MDK6028465.1 orotate phosphoribosyltransferase [Ignisphaera sp. 4213-co]
MSWIAVELYRHGMIKIGSFKLTSGLESPYYIDLRLLYSFPELRSKIIDELISRFSVFRKCDVVLGIATSGLVLASIIADKLNKPLAYVRIERKEHGTKSLVEGIVTDKQVVIVDDVATTGGSIEHAITAVKELGGKPIAAVTVIDREQGAKQRVKKYGIELYSLTTAREIFEHLHNNGFIDSNTYNKIVKYIKNTIIV